MNIKIELLKTPKVPKIYLSNLAFTQLIASCSTTIAKTKEIQFLGSINKINKFNFEIEKLLFTPQINSAAAVESDDDSYPEWLSKFSIEEKLKFRMYGHTHVNFSPTPSGTDETFIKEMISNVDDYFIQFIINNKGEFTLNIFDLTRGLAFYKLPLHYKTDDFTITFNEKIAYQNINFKDIIKNLNLSGNFNIANGMLKLTNNLFFDLKTDSYIIVDDKLIITKDTVTLSDKEEYIKEIEKELDKVCKKSLIKISYGQPSDKDYPRSLLPEIDLDEYFNQQMEKEEKQFRSMIERQKKNKKGKR